jgi:hypothetical protein
LPPAATTFGSEKSNSLSGTGGGVCSHAIGLQFRGRRHGRYIPIAPGAVEYDHNVASFLESAGVTFVAAFVAACWHVLSRNEKPEPQELAIGFDLVVSAMVLQTGFLPGSHGLGLDFRWAGLVVLFIVLTAMGVVTKMVGYDKSSELYRREKSGKRAYYTAVDRMTGRTALLTSMLGCAMLCIFWWLNVNIGLVVTAWQEVLR